MCSLFTLIKFLKLSHYHFVLLSCAEYQIVCNTSLLLYLIRLGLGRIAGILSLQVDDGQTQLQALQRVGSELAMHVVAAKPLFLTKELVPSDALENEREILKSQVFSLFFTHVLMNRIRV